MTNPDWLVKGARVTWTELPGVIGTISFVGMSSPTCNVKFDDGSIRACDKNKLSVATEAEIVRDMPSTQMSTEVEFKIEFDLPAIKFDEVSFYAAIDSTLNPIKALGDNLDKVTLTKALASLRKFKKSISARRIEIVKEVKAPIDNFEMAIKKGDAVIESHIVRLDAQLVVIEAEEKKAKKLKMDEWILDTIQEKELDQKHAAMLFIMEEYYLLKWTEVKIKDDLTMRADNLFKMQDYERVQQELRDTQIESRSRLIDQLNAEHGFTATYVQMPIEKYTDDQVQKFYVDKVEQRRVSEEAKAKQEALAEAKRKADAEFRARNELAIAEAVKQLEVDSADLPPISELKEGMKDPVIIPVPQGNNDSLPPLQSTFPGFTPEQAVSLESPVIPDSVLDSADLVFNTIKVGAKNQMQLTIAIGKLKKDGFMIQVLS